ncbi:MAG: sulfite exporter TauE/SafE family protein [Acidimicrobiia bacterium]
MNLTATEIGLLIVVALAGGLAQGTIGIGVGILMSPVLAIIEPTAVPTVIILLAMPLTVLMSVRERAHIDMRGFSFMLLGRVPGTVAGILLLAVLSGNAITVMSGTVILVAVGLSTKHTVPHPTAGLTFAGGAASGMMGTAAGVGGPPLALVYQGQDPAVVRSTLALSYLAGTVLSLAGLALAGEVTLWKARLAVLLVGPMLVGFAISTALIARLHLRWFRPAVLAFAAVAGAAAVVRGLGLGG